jgi:hypothetical protein
MQLHLPNLYLRARRFAKWKIRNLLTRRLHLRPAGLHASSAELAAQPGSGVTYTEVYPAYTSRLVVPEVFVKQAPKYFEAVAEQEQVAPAFVLSLLGGRLSVDNRNTLAIIAADNRLVGDVSLQFAPGTLSVASATANPIFQQRNFGPPLEIRGTVCSLLSGGGAEMGNYYHWLLDSLPRLHLVKEAGLWDSIDYFLIYSREHRFAMEMLLAMGIRDEQIIDARAAPHLRAERLVVTSPVRGTGRHAPTWVSAFLKEEFWPLAKQPGTKPFSPFVYVSRRDASFRRVRNEAEVEALLSNYGFESYALAELSFREKVTLFAGARAVVGPVGAGMANILFCRPGTPFIEFLPHNFVVADNLDLTTRLRMPHYPLISPPDTRSGGNAHADRENDLTVNITALKQALVLVLPQLATDAPGTLEALVSQF